MSSQTELPTKKELSELSIEALRVFAARNALRVLPFTVGQNEYDYLASNQEKEKEKEKEIKIKITALYLASIIGLFPSVPFSFSYAMNVASAASIVGLEASKENLNLVSGASRAIASAGTIVANPPNAKKVLFVNPAYNGAINAIHSYSLATLTASSTTSNDLALEARNDFNDLKQQLDINDKPLWRLTEQLNTFNQKLVQWEKAVK